MRPHPPEALFDQVTAPAFIPAPDLADWAKATFIAEGAPLRNPDHAHLENAEIGFLWTSVMATRHMNAIAGQAEMPRFQGSKWSKARQEQQMEAWFGELPDFVITIDARYAAQCDDITFCALIEHELYHCGQEIDQYGAPKFSRTTGLPVFAIKGHDVEEFVGVVRRYGVGAAAGQTLALVEAAQRGPEIGKAKATAACGSCRALIV
ncbi:putative metallopeptidase [Brevundimonas sp. GCM10030266]|uniref:putative metallopeptidase n=1 Tax=Brevundimonas sp. GCM10030266 TaxID=3273386 RepID=UPI00360EB134